MKKAVVLLSGGIDSMTCVGLARGKGYTAYCLIFDYGQRHRREIESAKRIARRLNCVYTLCKISFPWRGSSLLDKKKRIPKGGRGIPSTYVSARNIIFLSFALSYAEAIKAKAVFIGAHARDFSGYPDCRPHFYRAFKQVAKSGLKDKGIKVVTPLLYKNKAQIIRIAKRLALPLNLSWSCYRGGRRPCGVCDSCRIRARGFKQAKLKDPYAK